MLVYKISDYEGGSFCYRETDQNVLREFISFLDIQEAGNTFYVEVVDITREEFNNHARVDRF